MRKLLLVIAVSLLSLSNASNATISPSALWDKVKIERNSHGEIQELVIKSAGKKFSFADYISDFTTRARGLTSHPKVLQSRVAKMNLGLAEMQQESLKTTALQTLAGTDLVSVESDPKFKALVGQFGQQLNEIFLEQDVIAELNNSTFFFQATWRKDLLEWALSAAQSAQLTNVGASIIIYLFDKAIDDLIVRRTFYQNYTLHYLLAMSPTQLGLTSSEASLILSSLYEARIDFYNLPESDKAQADWQNYGASSLKVDGASCATRLAKHAENYQNIGTPYNLFFVPVESQNDQVVINVRDSLAFGNDQPSLAFDNGNQTSLKDLRTAYEVFLLGVNIAPIPGVAQTLVTQYLLTQFIPQIGSEGALMAHYELAGDTSRKQVVINQSVNPWLLADSHSENY